MTRIAEGVRSRVRERAKRRCEYCDLPEGVLRLSHQVDHIIPPRHSGIDEEHNFAWACYYCNHAKGTDIGTIDVDTQERVWLFHPRVDVWNDHFEMYDDGLIGGKTLIGRATARLLQMNNPEMVEIRRIMLEAELW